DEDREDESRPRNGNGEAAEAAQPEDEASEPAEATEDEAAPAAMALERHDDEPLRSEPVAEEMPAGNGDVAEVAEEAAPAPHPEHGVPAELGNGVETVEEDSEGQKVESVGAEDALEEVPRRQRRAPRRHYKIQEVIKRRQVILVQVVKEERGNKGAALTTYLSLAGRYCVLMPNTARGGGISRKITDAGDRRRLKEVARDIEIPQGMGLIVRTAGAHRTKAEIKRDYDYLLRLWESVRDLTLSSTAPALVYEEGSLIKRAIRDLYTRDVDEVQVEGEPAYREAKDFMKMLMPSHAKNVKLYKDTRPLFSRYQAESQLDSLYSPTVTLPSGGYMVMNQTEALVSVDINSGKATREHNIEDTAHRTNLEAADEIARQLRLRDLAGLIVIDFIDMEEKRNNRSVERRLKEALKNDRARIQVGRISHFGLLEMSRQRLRPGLLEGSSRTCPHCEGRGIVRSVSSAGLSVLRAIEEHLIARKPENLTVKCGREVAFYILNEKRDNLLSIETEFGISVFIVPSDEVKGSQAVIERAGERNIPPRRVQAAPVRIDSAFQEEEEPAAEEEASDEAEAAEEAPEAPSSGEGRSSEFSDDGGDRRDGGRRRRRRGRRGGRDRDRDATPRDEAMAGGGESDAAEPGADVPGLGDQPEVGGADGQESNGEAAETQDGSEDRGRRDRWGRHRDRDRGGRRPHDERRYGGRDSDAQRSKRGGERFAEEGSSSAPRSEPPPPKAPEIVIPEAPTMEVEPRKWQPPAPTAPVAASERKSGWWSKR
ncbi:MAG: ribonuclease E/G, partial [Alphaproteobacteria bacterium]|nr:ribonuclease E/G [Alphaproteobacteria bacterium]